MVGRSAAGMGTPMGVPMGVPMGMEVWGGYGDRNSVPTAALVIGSKLSGTMYLLLPRFLGEYRFIRVCVQPYPSAMYATLPALAAESRRLLHESRSAPVSTDNSCPHGAQQQTHRPP